MDNPGPRDHCHTLNEVSEPGETGEFMDTPNKAAANCKREKGAGALGAGAAMIRRVVVRRWDGWHGKTSECARSF